MLLTFILTAELDWFAARGYFVLLVVHLLIRIVDIQKKQSTNDKPLDSNLNLNVYSCV